MITLHLMLIIGIYILKVCFFLINKDLVIIFIFILFSIFNLILIFYLLKIEIACRIVNIFKIIGIRMDRILINQKYLLIQTIILMIIIVNLLIWNEFLLGQFLLSQFLLFSLKVIHKFFFIIIILIQNLVFT